MRFLVIAAFALAGACSSGESAGQQGGAAVPQDPPETEYAAAFAGQTRAPQRLSGVNINVEPIASGLDHPWALAFMPDGRILVTERSGALRVVTREGAVSAPVTGLPAVDARNQGGLLDIALNPGFAQDRLLYWTFSEPRGNGTNTTALARGRLNEQATRVEDVRVIFRQAPAWRSTGHFGSRIVFDREGYIFVGLGDRQRDDARELAQDVSNHIGAVVRIDANGAPAPGNPFIGREGARAEIWSYGHRNIQGAALHPETGVLWTVEHGPRGGDELNPAHPGRNYGWPLITYGIEYRGDAIHGGATQLEGMEQPIYYWDPVIAPSGLIFYRGDLFPWRGNILIGGLVTRALVRLEIDGERVTGEERFALDVGRIRDVAEDDDGAIWIVTDENDGRLIRLTPAL